MNPQTQSQNLDPSVVALTKAIGKSESGGKYDVGDNTGDGAHSYGAYQMTPAFIKQWAPVAGVQPGQNLDPASQDKIAYTAVQTLGTKGDPSRPQLGKLTPAQITSYWNTGSPNAYLDPEYGKNNTYGSTANQVDQVSKYYDEYMGTPPKTASNPLVSTANAASGPAQNSGSAFTGVLEGLGLGALGFLAGHAKSYLQEAIPDIASNSVTGALLGTAVEPGGGTLAGGLVGGASGLVEPLVKGVVKKAVGAVTNPQPSPQTQIQSPAQAQPMALDHELPQSAAASETVRDAITKTMNGTQTGRVFSQSAPGQQAINTAAQYGLVEPDEQGNLVFNEDKRKGALSTLAEAEKKMVIAEDGSAPMAFVLQRAQEQLDKNKTLTPNERTEAMERVQKEARSYAPDDGQMKLSDMVDARHQQYAATGGKYNLGKTTSQIEAHKALAFGFRQGVQENVQNKDLYNAVLKEESNLINAKQVGKKVHGKKAPKNNAQWQQFLKGAAKYAEIYIGDKLGGPVGAILGTIAGEHINRAIDKKYGKTIFETKSMKAAMDILNDTKPEVYNKLIEELKKHGVSIEEKEITEGKDESTAKLIKDAGTGGMTPEELDKLVNKGQYDPEELMQNFDDRARATRNIDPREPHARLKRQIAGKFLDKAHRQVTHGLVTTRRKR